MYKQSPWFWLVLWFLPFAAHAQDVFTLTADRLQTGQAVELDKLGWKYSPDDNPRFAEPQFDDSAWETLNGTAITLDSIPKSGWRGLGWFRLRLQVDSALANQPLALVMVHYGASEIYLDGKLVERFGTVGTTPETEVAYNPNTQPFGFVLDGRREHVIAVRHSCSAMRDQSSWWSRWLDRLSNKQNLKIFTSRTNEFGAGFGIKIQELKSALANNELEKSLDRNGFNLYASGITLTIGLLHLLMYWFYMNQRANLYFGLFSSFASINQFTDFLLRTAHYGAKGITVLYVAITLSFNLALLFALASLYTVFLTRLPKRFWFWVIATAFVFFSSLLDLIQLSLLIFFALVLIEAGRLVVQALRNKVDEAWVLGIGLLLCGGSGFLNGAYGMTGTPPPVFLRSFLILSLVLPPSIFLARQFARTSRHLEEQLIQVKRLSDEKLVQERREAELRVQHEKEKAENERRAAELEEARQLQLSMLPKKLPQLPHLDIAAYMKTATEVGGDYYDFHLGEDSTLTIAVGDATGHGLKAGTMVTAVKSLFDTLAYHPDIPHIFERLTRTLKRMNLRGLFMALTVAKINHHQLVLSVAGMPPVLLYRATTQQVEAVELKALPLGGVVNYHYQQVTLALAAGDAVVLMSDGLPERFNEKDELLGEEPIHELLAQVGNKTATEIIAALIQAGDDWAGARPQDDDVTFVVVKMKE